MKLPEIKKFNIRVYGILINNKNEILLSDEIFKGVRMTKFPGGGMEPGEGPASCMLREGMEEFGQQIEIIDHFYTTHFFQRSLFYPDQQVISIYYLIKLSAPASLKTSDKPFDLKGDADGTFSFRWIPLNSLTEDDMTLPLDKYVVTLLKNRDKKSTPDFSPPVVE
jgi:ADP-ribose pyrophosphatase YjhB (NUDIX family)